MGIHTVTNITSYAHTHNRETADQYLVLSFSNQFRDKLKSTLNPEKSSIIITFAEISPSEVVDWNSYVVFFLKILTEVSYVIIDTEYYSEGFKIFQSCAINSESVKEIQIWKDQNDEENYRIIAESEVNSPLSKKERTYIKR